MRKIFEGLVLMMLALLVLVMFGYSALINTLLIQVG